MKRILVILSVVFTTCAFAQKSNFNSFTRSTGQQIVDSALRNVFHIVEAEYAVSDSTGQQYGQNGQPYFAKRQYLALAIQGGKVLPAEAFRPWVNDETFTPYATNYTPVLRQLQIREINDTTVRPISLTVEDTLSLNDDYVLVKDNGDGLQLATQSGRNDGYLVLVYKGLTGNYQQQLIRQQIDSISTGPQTIGIKTLLTGIIGGVWIEVETPKVGHLQFLLGGIVRPTDNNRQVQIVYPFNTLQAIPAAPSNQLQESLTPIRSNESGQKATNGQKAKTDKKKTPADKKKSKSGNKAKKDKQSTNTK